MMCLLRARCPPFAASVPVSVCQPLWMGYAYAVGMVLSSGAQAGPP